MGFMGRLHGTEWFCRVRPVLDYQWLSGVPVVDIVLRGSIVLLPFSTHSFPPCLPPAEQLTHTNTHVCTHEDWLEIKLQARSTRNLDDWMSGKAEIQIVNQSDAQSLCSPHHHLIRGPPMSLKFPVHWVAPHKECHQHCTGFVDHIRYDHVLPAPSFSTFFQINIFQLQRPYHKKANISSNFFILNVISLWFPF